MERELTAEMLGALSNLPDRERVVVTKFYLEGRTLKEIGSELGVTESRACQIAKAGTSRMRQRLLARQ